MAFKVRTRLRSRFGVGWRSETQASIAAGTGSIALTQQIVLSLDPSKAPDLDEFVVGANQELLAALTATVGSNATSFWGLWLYGPTASGRTHLLQGWVNAQNGVARYLDCEPLQRLSDNAWQAAAAELLRQIDCDGVGQCLALDNVGGLLEREAGKELLMAVYEALLSSRGRLLVGHSQSVLHTHLNLADLRSRLLALPHFSVVPLQDDDKAKLLRLRAQQCGYGISDAVLTYWLRRGPRRVDQLLEDLARLNVATLREQRLLTIPLLKEVLGY